LSDAESENLFIALIISGLLLIFPINVGLVLESAKTDPSRDIIVTLVSLLVEEFFIKKSRSCRLLFSILEIVFGIKPLPKSLKLEVSISI
jgi:hypothetical protein